ncbi:MAG: DUF5615 family PIN-like protein [Actinobacteria bacterium]|nr:DUF5615 family PIN-like protein [Actinomycetota bacterium]
MRFLADMPISRSTVEHLKSKGYDVVHLLDLGLGKAKDQDIAKLAEVEKRILLTADLDFATILASSKLATPSVIIFRLHDSRPVIINNLLDRYLLDIALDLERGSLAIFEETRVRVRNLPI